MKFLILTLVLVTASALAESKPATLASLQADLKSADLYAPDRSRAMREIAAKTATDSGAWLTLYDFLKYRNSHDGFLPSVQGDTVLELSKLAYRDESFQATLDYVKRSDVQIQFRLLTVGEAALGNFGRVEAAAELRKIFLRAQNKQSSGQESLSVGLEALYSLRKICEANPGNAELKTLIIGLKSSINDASGIIARALKVDEIEELNSTPQHEQTAALAGFFDLYLGSSASAPAAVSPPVGSDIAPALKHGM